MKKIAILFWQIKYCSYICSVIKNKNKMQYTKDFEKLVRKMRRKHQTCLNYIFRMKDQTLTEGFWWNHGYTFDDQLTTLREKYTDQWKHYCEKEGICWDAVVGDWLS